MQRSMPNPKQPDISRLRLALTQQFARRNHILPDCPTPTVHIDRDHLPVVLRFNLLSNLALVDPVAEPGGLFSRAVS